MLDRTSTVDGKAYAIGFEMRLPDAWNGRFFYQANGGTDGSVVTGERRARRRRRRRARSRRASPSSARTPGTTRRQNPTFGIDPQARLDYGYQAVGKLTPMAKSVIQTAYGKAPDRSYIGGCSNGGRHALVAASRYADQYDGFLVGRPGLAAAARGAGQHRRLPDLCSAWRRRRPTCRPASRSPSAQLVSNAVLAKCDALDGATDGLVQDTHGLPGGVRPEPRRADLRRRARRHLPQRSAEDRHRQAVLGRDDEHRHQDLQQLPVRQRPGDGRLVVLEVHRAADPRRRRDRLHLAGAAGRPGDLQRTDVRGDEQHRRPLREDPGDQRDLHRELAVVHDAAEPERPVGAEEPGRQAASSTTAPRPDLLERRQRRLRRRAARDERRRRVELRPPVPDPRDEPLQRRPGDRPVRHAHAARQLGREGRRRPDSVHRERARREQRRRCQRRRPGDLVGEPDASAVQPSEGRALQRQRQPRSWRRASPASRRDSAKRAHS